MRNPDKAMHLVSKYGLNVSQKHQSFKNPSPARFLLPSALLVLIGAGLITMAFASCARPGAPTGGPRDTAPPKVDSSASTPNLLTRFDRKTIELKFDEWVTLSDANTQVIVSPPLKTRRVPEVLLKGKTVVLKLPEEEQLKPNTTYTINFGNAVKDLHEGNPAKDLRYVFSTGDFIDSLTISGVAVDAFSQEFVENVAVMLYDNLADSVPIKEKPYYYTRTDKTGVFKISNVKNGTFKLVAVQDKDQNLLWNASDEPLAFLSEPLNTGDTSSRQTFVLKLQKNQPTAVRLGEKINPQYGQIRLQYNAPPDSIRFSALPPNAADLKIERLRDSVVIWYALRDSLPFKLLAGRDTVALRNYSRSDFQKNHRLAWAEEGTATKSTSRKTQAPAAPAQILSMVINPVKAAELPFNYPIIAMDTARWRIKSDSIFIKNFAVKADSANPRALRLNAAWLADKSHELTLLPGAITDFWGKSNTDTLRRKFTAISEKQLGDLSLTIEGLLPQTHYFLQLYNGSVLSEVRTFKSDGVTKKLIFNKLESGNFKVELTEDLNANGRRDAADYFRRRQPERVHKKELPALRPGWEVEAVMRLEK